MKQLDIVAAVLVVVGALNWGLVAVARFDLVAALFGMRFGEVSALSAAVYGLVGLAGLYQGLFWKRVQSALDAAGRASSPVNPSSLSQGAHMFKSLVSTTLPLPR